MVSEEHHSETLAPNGILFATGSLRRGARLCWRFECLDDEIPCDHRREYCEHRVGVKKGPEYPLTDPESVIVIVIVIVEIYDL